MEKHIKNGLANQVKNHFENMLQLREEFILNGDPDNGSRIGSIAKNLLDMYLELTEE